MIDLCAAVRIIDANPATVVELPRPRCVVGYRAVDDGQVTITGANSYPSPVVSYGVI